MKNSEQQLPLPLQLDLFKGSDYPYDFYRVC